MKIPNKRELQQIPLKAFIRYRLYRFNEGI